MALTCNIDAKGRRVRMVLGIVEVVAALLLVVFWALPGGGWLAWCVSIALLCMGLFAVFEARAGWCAVRALGIKTRV